MKTLFCFILLIILPASAQADIDDYYALVFKQKDTTLEAIACYGYWENFNSTFEVFLKRAKKAGEKETIKTVAQEIVKTKTRLIFLESLAVHLGEKKLLADSYDFAGVFDVFNPKLTRKLEKPCLVNFANVLRANRQRYESAKASATAHVDNLRKQ